MVMIDFKSPVIHIVSIPYNQCDEKAEVRLMNNNEKERFIETVRCLNLIIKDSNILEQEMRSFIEKKRRSVLGVFTPYMNEYIRAAASRHWLPYCLPKSKVLSMFNYISCEAQRDVTLGFFEEYSGIKQ